MPCWNSGQVTKAISRAAQTNAASASYFLASHSPFRQITDLKSTGRNVNEEDVYTDLFSNSHAQVQAFVMGEPGTGKSHLIRWLYERCRYEIREGETTDDKQRIVLVTRGNGSLKDALGQIVRQLGSEFEQHIHRVQGAIDRITGQTARAMLLAELALEIDTRWVNEHARDPLPPSHRHLGEALRSNGFGKWMMRGGGVIDQIIQRLTDGSTTDDRETSPIFQADDFDVPAVAFKAQEVSRQVLDFVEDLKEEPDTRKLIADTLNIALSDAIRSLTGLKGSDLLDIFNEIRRQLGPTRQLLVLIEDVSIFELDQDVVNAFEPRSGEGLCRMVAILGITTNGWRLMLDNQKQRATHQFEVGGDTAKNWASDRNEVAKFTARYLNTIRSEDEVIRTIAADRFTGDIRRSRCDECPWKPECHAAFGYADFGNDVAVGMFPFNLNAPQAMLRALTAVSYKSQRGLLEDVLLPALEFEKSFQSLVSREFPNPAYFRVQPNPIQFWTAGFLPRYCNGAGWSERAKNRLRFLAQIWFNEQTAELLAGRLSPLLGPLGFPSFSGKVVEPPEPPEPPLPGGTSIKPPPPIIVDKELIRLLGLLDSWHDGSPLKEDSKFRELLVAFISKCINWQDHPGVPITEKKRLFTGGSAIPRIENQSAKPSGKYAFDFPRDAETHGLLQGLLMLNRSPSKTWDFAHGEAHKRSVSRWLRKHRSKVAESVNPADPGIVQGSLRAAVHALALIAFLRDRRNLPSDRVERISCLFRPVWSVSERPVIMTPEFQRIVEDLEEKHSNLSDFVVQEVGAGQGSSDPKDFINPLPILNILNDLSKDFRLLPAPEEAGDSYWSPRFLTVDQLRKGAFQNIHDRLAKEREAMARAVGSISSFVTAAGFTSGNPRERISQCLEEFKELIDEQQGPPQRRGVLEFPDESFEKLWKEKLFQDTNVRSSWAVAYDEGIRISISESDLDIVVFNPRRLKECRDVLLIAERHVELLESHLEDEMKTDGGGGDNRIELLEVLDEIGKLLDTEGAQTTTT